MLNARDLKSTSVKGAFINHVNMEEGGGLPKCSCYYISLVSKMVPEGGSKMSKNPSTWFMDADAACIRRQLKKYPYSIFWKFGHL